MNFARTEGNYKDIILLIDDTIYIINKIIQDFSKIGDEYIALKLLVTFFEAVECITQSVMTSKVSLENYKVNKSIKHIMSQLENLLRCMENEDYILLCDILEIEISSNLNIISKGFSEALIC